MPADTTASRFVLASRSPRRRELLALIVPAGRIDVVPPPDAREEGFEALHDLPAIERRLAAIARAKADAVSKILKARTSQPPATIIAADTEIVVRDDTGACHVLGQPPESPDWPQVVNDWFRRYYAGRAHWALSGVCVVTPDGQRLERIVRTEVEFHADIERWLPWYLKTEESRGKAGGYAVQGAGSIFVRRIEGSISNVVGLPLEALLEMLQDAAVIL